MYYPTVGMNYWLSAEFTTLDITTSRTAKHQKMRLECEVVMLKENAQNPGISISKRPTRSSKAIVTLGKNHMKGGFRYLLHIATRTAPKGPQIE
ncbi:hypothetical protein NECAME_14281, partial [Necator americanus]